MNILIAPNAFKNSLNAAEAATAIRNGLHKSALDCDCECFPIADGGDGTGELIVRRCAGIHVDAPVRDPLGRKMTSSFGLIDQGNTAVIEMANASGLRLLKSGELDPLHATSFGTGELIRLALDRGAKKIVIAMGGSATVDGGCGILQALGVVFLDAGGKLLGELPAALDRLAVVDTSLLDARILKCEVDILCDVDNRLLGEDGAANIFGPQKGASAADVEILEAGLKNFAAVTLGQTGKDITTLKYGGTAGGASAGLHAYINARLVNGIDRFCDLTGFDRALDRADILITGEGSLDDQTLQGKGPFGVASRAKSRNIPVIGLAGKVPAVKSAGIYAFFDILLPIAHQPSELVTAMQHTAAGLERTAREVGDLLAMGMSFWKSKQRRGHEGR